MTDIEIWPVGRQTGIMACRTWHYSGTLPTTAWSYGYWRGAEFDGVIAFRRQWVGPSTHAWWAGVFGSPEIVELCRIALRPQVERPPTSRYISLALGELRRLGYDGVGAYTDVGQPDPQTGELHTGGVYRAASWTELPMTYRREIMYWARGAWRTSKGGAGQYMDGDTPPPIRRDLKRRYGMGLTRRGRRALRRYMDTWRENGCPRRPGHPARTPADSPAGLQALALQPSLPQNESDLGLLAGGRV